MVLVIFGLTRPTKHVTPCIQEGGGATYLRQNYGMAGKKAEIR